VPTVDSTADALLLPESTGVGVGRGVGLGLGLGDGVGLGVGLGLGLGVGRGIGPGSPAVAGNQATRAIARSKRNARPRRRRRGGSCGALLTGR
jgi:hypothetical protein